MKEYRKQYQKAYYKQNKKALFLKMKQWRTNNPEKVREYIKICRLKKIEKYREKAREVYKQWISIEKNRKHKKQYQKEWFQNRYQFIKEERQEFNEIMKVLEKGYAIINEYEVNLKQDKGGKWFYYLKQNKTLVYMSDKFNTKKEAVKDIQYAV